MAAKHRCGQGKALFSGLDVAASWKQTDDVCSLKGWITFFPLRRGMTTWPAILLFVLIVWIGMSFASSVNCLPGNMDAHAYTMLILTQLSIWNWLVILFLSSILVPWVARYQQLFLDTRVSEITKAFGDVMHGISLACSPTDFSLHFQSSFVIVFTECQIC